MTEEQEKKLFHDLKNNLASMTSLLNLHRMYTDTIDSEEMLNKLSLRQTIITTAYQHLYQENDYTNINIPIYIGILMSRQSQILNGYCSNVQVFKSIDILRIPIKQAMLLAHILFELISNSYQHAFKETTERNINFSIRKSMNNIIRLEYSDSGCGLPEGIEPEKERSLGMQFITSLSKQLGGKPEYIAKNEGSGMSFALGFSIS